MGKARKLKYSFDEEEQYEQKHSKQTCAYCGRTIENTNDTGSLCYRCYIKEYYPEHAEDPDWL